MRTERRGVSWRERIGETWPDPERTMTMTTRLIRFTQRVTPVDDSNWEPDGVTHHVRFCEGGGMYPYEGTSPATHHVAIKVLPEQFTIDSSVTERSLTGERRRVRPEKGGTRLPSGPRPLGGP